MTNHRSRPLPPTPFVATVESYSLTQPNVIRADRIGFMTADGVYGCFQVGQEILNDHGCPVAVVSRITVEVQ